MREFICKIVGHSWDSFFTLSYSTSETPPPNELELYVECSFCKKIVKIKPRITHKNFLG